MSAEITTQRSIEYTSNLQLLSQQLGSRLRGAVMVGNHRGKQAVPVDQIGSVEMYQIAGRRQTNNFLDTPHRRRWVFPSRYAAHETIDIADEVENLSNPGSMYARAQAAAAGREIDRIILRALTGTSTTGETGAGTEAFDTTNNRFGGGAGALTFDDVNQALRVLREQTHDHQETIYAAVSATAIEDMLAEPKFTSADYQSVRALVTGNVSTFMGVTWIPTEMTSVLTVGADKGVLFWMKSGAHLGIWEDVNGKVDVRSDMEHLTQISTYFNAGATRVEQAKVVWVQYQ